MARRLMACIAFYPRSTFDGIEERQRAVPGGAAPASGLLPGRRR
jgi:hypothetical protein